MQPDFEAAKAAFLEGLRCHGEGLLEQAEQHYRASLTHLPGRPSTLSNLGATLNALGRPLEALPLLDQATQAEPQQAEGWLQRADALSQLGRLEDALASIERVLALDPQLGPAWSRKAGLLKDLGRPGPAAQAFRQAIALGDALPINGYLLASIEGRAAPPQPPAGYVQKLFDSYADGFDEHLVQRLDYRAPQRLVQLLAGQSRRFTSALDLGCGTGLCGPLLRPLVDRLHGVDLSPRMLAQARARGVYDELALADIAHHLATTPQRHDLLLAADVFIYIGDLGAVFAGARRVLQPGGLFAFSVEAADEALDFELRPSSRYAQSARYLQTLASRHGLQVLQLSRDTLRLDQRQPVEGLYVLLSA